jgi:hypothetical protein
MLIVDCITPSAQSKEEATAGLCRGDVNRSASPRGSSDPVPNIHGIGNRAALNFQMVMATLSNFGGVFWKWNGSVTRKNLPV